ncbi:hypothetical protein IFR05_014081 [Cadophora sp. M221]|nr:hypothetical protein IFR05_014081 [Cadophora sp. M221]
MSPELLETYHEKLRQRSYVDGFTFNETNPYGVPDSALPLQYPNLPFSDIGTGADTSYGLWYYMLLNRRPTWYLWALVGMAYDYGAVALGDLPAGDYRDLLRALRWVVMRAVKRGIKAG